MQKKIAVSHVACVLRRVHRFIAPALLLIFSALSTPFVLAAGPTYALMSGQWHQLTIPGNSSDLTIQSLFEDKLPADGYNSSWVIYLWDNVANEYVNPGLTGTIPTGQGFWMIQLTGDSVVLETNDLSGASLRNSSACPSNEGCVQVQLRLGNSISPFAMIGSALPTEQAINTIRLVADENSENCRGGCSHSAAVEFGLLEYPIWRYNSISQTYDNLADSGTLNPWESAWFQTSTGLVGVGAEYYFPAIASSIGECQSAPALLPVTESDAGKTIVRVGSVFELNTAIRDASPNTVVLIEPGIYQLTGTLVVSQDNVTIRGNSDSCNAVRLVGMGMDNPAGAAAVPHGIWTNADFLKVQNLTIENVYNHPISIDSRATAPQIYNVAMLDAGEQFVKVNPSTDGQGSNNGRIEYSVMKYRNGPPLTDHGAGIGYTQGISLHNGDNWLIRNNRFENMSTPDSSDYLWNPAVLAWNSSRNTVVENNIFIDVDRAIAFGLIDREGEHVGGVIRNNMIVMRENLYSQERKNNADAPIVIWSSTDTQVLHNTVLTNGNTPFAIEIRFNSNGAVLRNNLTDAPIRDRSNNQYIDVDNILFNDASIFRAPREGDLHLQSNIEGVTGAVPTLSNAAQDIDGQPRTAIFSDAGADEFTP